MESCHYASPFFFFFSADTQYLGVRGELQNASTISPTFSSDNIETCVETCRTYGFRYFMISASEIPGNYFKTVNMCLV